MRRRGTRTLRFLHVRNQFLVFDARNGACNDGGIYNLLNVRCGGYSPSDFDTPQEGIVPGGCGMTRATRFRQLEAACDLNRVA
jgi:hypothetical protein